MIKNIVLDVNGVLDDKARSLRKWLEKLKISELLLFLMVNCLPEWKKYNRGKYKDTAEIAEAIARRYPYVSAAIKRTLTKAAGIRFWQNSELISYINELRGKYGIYILTNQTTGDFEKILKCRFIQQAEGIVSSCQCGYLKPEREIYEHLLNKYNLIAEECLFIDDNIWNITAARKLGFKVIHYLTNKQAIREMNRIINTRVK